MVKVISPGFYSTIQDLGRFGYRQFGVPISGVMDSYSAKLANAILGNDENDAGLEITIKGPVLEFQTDTVICITGADLSPILNSILIENNKPISVKKGDVLSFGRLNHGVRSYLSVLGGFQTHLAMNSRSMYKNITESQIIKKDDLLIINENIQDCNFNSISVDTRSLKSNIVEAYQGPEFDKLSKEEKKTLFSQKFTISKENNRMAYQLNELVINKIQPIITSLVLPGTVQLTPSGKLIILMRDCQTTGGYPRVFQLSEKGINTLAQKFTNDLIEFKLLTQ
ncbi:biotin-dependent carboxyltransferase family protein [Yeosuana sp. MJ-SS3]|uniref:Biotin-dependent carboxyltransferase family protein n=1 Tax=Gilvirhabdus luticola TaxID=3079858 RepID=A0ABU3U7F7_9FLAO|nr:biotin-dependent carboxyltransferase family protein [Yeosuana sp. MJ-SS3]MDU8886257.1 biotin-dependent carboxyltransferase family protein [Yeosuana sp. MJ-SS3]